MLNVLIKTLLSRLLLFLIIIVYSIPMLIIFFMPKEWLFDSKVFFYLVHSFYWLVIKCSLVPIRFFGLEHMPTSASIIVANHQSSLDIPIIGYAIGHHAHVWLAIAYLKRSPILRFILPKIAILVDMSSPQKGMRSLVQGLRHIYNKERHVIIFPEGGRQLDGQIHKFFPGFTILAKKTNRSVVPIRIFGAHKVYPPKSFLVRYYPIKVLIGSPLFMQENESNDHFTERVHAWFIVQQEPQGV
jgi:1-acyl-sn-glycerol-3-phosphate acyltransferase